MTSTWRGICWKSELCPSCVISFKPCLCIPTAWLGVSGVSGHVGSQTKPAAARSASRLGGAAGQPGTNLLCEPREQNHAVVAADDAVKTAPAVCVKRCSADGESMFVSHLHRDGDVAAQRRQRVNMEGEQTFITRRQISDHEENTTLESPEVGSFAFL